MTDYYTTHTLENIARYVIKQHDPYFFKFEPQAVPIERIIEDTYCLTIDCMRLTMSGEVLGRMIYDNGYDTCYNPEKDKYELVRVTKGTIIIESLLLEHPRYYGRYRFTLAHELAHWIIHKKLFTGTRTAAASHKSSEISDNAVEWQANYLAAAILMPAGLVKCAYYQAKARKAANIAKELAGIFEVSAQAMKIRLNELVIESL
jgi:hypothetical protein